MSIEAIVLLAWLAPIGVFLVTAGIAHGYGAGWVKHFDWDSDGHMMGVMLWPLAVAMVVVLVPIGVAMFGITAGVTGVGKWLRRRRDARNGRQTNEASSRNGG